MGGLFSKPKIEAPKPPPPAPTRDAAAEAAAEEKRRVSAPGGRASTILTSPLGVDDENPSAKMYLGA